MGKIMASRVSRLRAAALIILLFGFMLGAALGTRLGASTETAITGAKLINYLVSPEAGGGSFNWFIFLLASGPALMSACILYGTAEVANAVSRRSRSRSSSQDEEKTFDDLDLR